MAPGPPEEQRPLPGSLLFTALQVCVWGFCPAPPPVAEQPDPGGPCPPTAEQPARPPAPACELVNAGWAGPCWGAPAAGCCGRLAAQAGNPQGGSHSGLKKGVQSARALVSARGTAAVASCPIPGWSFPG
ncbi:MAG: hypothetical protein JNJ88_14140 [Planctomycetes bacterium]|nr:hypothetical protein [Planctomycetota bacterium]